MVSENFSRASWFPHPVRHLTIPSSSMLGRPALLLISDGASLTTQEENRWNTTQKGNRSLGMQASGWAGHLVAWATSKPQGLSSYPYAWEKRKG